MQTLLTQEEKLLIQRGSIGLCRTSCRIRGSELFRALSDSIDVIHERVRRKPTVAMVVTYNRAMSAMMPIIPGPSRLLREVDVMEDESVWAILDEGCDTTCHSRQWRENAEAKFLNHGFVVERDASKK